MKSSIMVFVPLIAFASSASSQRANVELKRDVTIGYAPTSMLAGVFADKGAANNSTVLGIPFADMYSGLLAIRDDVPIPVFDNFASITFEASDFLPPAGLGIVSSKYRALFSGKGKTDLPVKDLLGRVDTETVGGKRYWKWKKPGYEGHPDETTYFASSAEGSLLLCNDFEVYRQTVGHTVSATHADVTAGLAYKVCRKEQGVGELQGIAPMAGVTKVCLEATSDAKASVVFYGKKESILVAAQKLGLKGNGEGRQDASLSWSMPHTGPFATNLWWGVMYYLGFGISV